MKYQESRLVIDLAGCLHGRSAYVCPDIACLDVACRAGGFSRSFHKSVSGVDPRELARALAVQLQNTARNREDAQRRQQGLRVQNLVSEASSALQTARLYEIAAGLEEGAALLSLSVRPHNKSRDRQHGKH